MSDIRCVKCGEPFDQDELHDWNDKSYTENLHAYQREGCGALDLTCNTIAGANGDAVMVASTLYDILGDDIDCMEDMMDMARDLGLKV